MSRYHHTDTIDSKPLENLALERHYRQEQGNIPILVLIILILLIGTGLAYMKWAADEGMENRYELAALQAHYLAQTGIVERGFSFLRSREPGNLPIGRIDLFDGVIPGAGRYKKTYIIRDTGHTYQDVFRWNNYYDIYSTGVTTFMNSSGEEIEVERTSSLKVRLRSFVDYFYLTDHEETIFGEYINWWTPDTVWGRVHSNDFISIRGGAVFMGPVTTSQSHFLQGPGYNPYFEYPPQFNVPPVTVPTEAYPLRNCAGASGLLFDGEGQFNHRIVFNGESGFNIYKWEIGSPYNDSLVYQGPPLHEAVLFVDGPLELKGRLHGTVTIGCTENIRLIDDIWYVDSHPNGEVDSNSTNYLGIVSEGNIIVGNTWVNGRENACMGSDIIINAALMTLGESFTFEDQNDVWETYAGPYPDERGTIHLWGTLVQKRRGYVHRSNHGGSGYGKDYHFDKRFNRQVPPCYLYPTDYRGNSLFDVIAWGVE